MYVACHLPTGMCGMTEGEPVHDTHMLAASCSQSWRHMAMLWNQACLHGKLLQHQNDTVVQSFSNAAMHGTTSKKGCD